MTKEMHGRTHELKATTATEPKESFSGTRSTLRGSTKHKAKQHACMHASIHPPTHAHHESGKSVLVKLLCKVTLMILVTLPIQMSCTPKTYHIIQPM